MEELKTSAHMHKISITNRRSCLMSGIHDVLSFDIHEVLLETEQGMLVMKGENLHVSRLSLEKGEVDIDGKIDSLTYSDVSGTGHKKESLLARLFR
jgi:sporulation protein YabP